MPRVFMSSNGVFGISKYVGGGCFIFLSSILVIIGLLGIAALIYSLT